uniref:Transposase n=1 Tax=Anaerobacillus isosaccharinicus TaxID=1532552 RepID=A0A7S7L9H7_9BACI|nr:transposase [Anaerobacillus isosaccharinicus]QOY36806.1 transposase [Anaerobacillus isosaccharinicus]
MQELKILIKEIYDEQKGRYGYCHIKDELVIRGYKNNHKKVQRLMKEQGLKSMVRMNNYRSYKGNAGKTAPNIFIVILRQKNQMKNG